MLSAVHVQRDAPQPLYRQIYASLRQAILQQQLQPGVRLPSTRDLADMLDVSRNTVMNAFDLLLAEGYVETRVGAGTYVTGQLPEAFLQAYNAPPQTEMHGPSRTVSQRGQILAAHYRELNWRRHPAFAPSSPDLDAFPFATWARLAARIYRQNPRPLLQYGQDPRGYGPLREALAGYLRSARGVRCHTDQVIIVAGSQQGLYLAGQVLLDRGDRIWVEDPGYVGGHGALRFAGAEFVPVPVDEEGLDPEAAPAAARAAYVTPSHQFPLGYTMSLARRTRLLQWAAEEDGWIIEDDYDSAFRYSGPPLASLQGLDSGRRVIYVGSFSKVLFPGLRMGYLVVPEDLVGAFLVARGAINLFLPVIPQATLAAFIDGGHFTRHLRRMRIHYRRRRDAFVAALDKQLGDLLTIGPANAGLHLTAWLPSKLDGATVQAEAAKRQITVQALATLSLRPPARDGLVMGFGNVDAAEMDEKVQLLAQAVRVAHTHN
jgi:GntR family transcriptional regulator/MocR family aminotransferase